MKGLKVGNDVSNEVIVNTIFCINLFIIRYIILTIWFFLTNHDDVVEVKTKKSEQVTLDQNIADKMQHNIRHLEKVSVNIDSVKFKNIRRVFRS